MISVFSHGDAVELIHGDSREVLAALPENSIDAMVTDPPAGIGFLGKEWDSDRGGRRQWVAWFTEIMALALRALKPGGHAFVWAIPRTSHWAAWALEDAGFEVRDVHHHLFGTGFPKAVSLDKAIDKRQDTDAKLQRARAVQTWCREAAQARGLSAADLDRACGTSDMGAHWLTHPTQPEIAHEEHWPAICGLLGEPPPEVEALILDYLASRRKPGADWQAREVTGEHERATAAARAWRENDDKGERKDDPFSEAAKTWKGWATALKPAAEHWILVRKPLTTTIAQNVIAHGTGGLNTAAAGVEGRWPRHVSADEGVPLPGPGWLFTAKPSSRERDAGCEELEARAPSENVGRAEDSAGINNPRAGAGRTSKRKNHHPTVKPVSLMSWLVKLITPPGGVVLDPFLGSGTTGVAAVGNGFRFIGIEKETDYISIPIARISHALKQGSK